MIFPHPSQLVSWQRHKHYVDGELSVCARREEAHLAPALTAGAQEGLGVLEVVARDLLAQDALGGDGHAVSRHDERTGKWSRLTPRELGTASPIKAVCVSPKRDDVWVLSLLGGIIGILIGAGVAVALPVVAGWATVVPWNAIVLSFAVSAATIATGRFADGWAVAAGTSRRAVASRRSLRMPPIRADSPARSHELRFPSLRGVAQPG